MFQAGKRSTCNDSKDHKTRRYLARSMGAFACKAQNIKTHQVSAEELAKLQDARWKRENLRSTDRRYRVPKVIADARQK